MPHLATAQFTPRPIAIEPPASVTMSPLLLADRLITLAKDADRSGFVVTADQLVRLAYAIWDGTPTSRA